MPCDPLADGLRRFGDTRSPSPSDELCRSGTLLSSPALSFSQDRLKALLAQIKPEVKNEEDESQEAKVGHGLRTG